MPIGSIDLLQVDVISKNERALFERHETSKIARLSNFVVKWIFKLVSE